LYDLWLERWIAPAAAAKMARLGHAANAKGGAAAAQGPRIQDRFSRAAILRALEGNPKDPGLNRAMADLLIQEGDHARALELLSVVEAADGLQPADILQIGQCQLALGQFDAALESAEMYLALEAEAEAGILLAAQSARGTARPSRAVAYWRELFELGSHRREACLTIAEIETGRGKHAEALTWVERLIAIDPDSAEARRLHAELLALTGAPDARLSSALARLAGLDRRSFFDAFDRVTAQGRYLAAAAALRAMLDQASPDRQVRSMVRGCAREWLMKGRECVAAGDELAAAVLFQASEMLDPEDARAARGLKKIEAGWRKHIRAAFRERDFPKVIEAGEPVLALRPQLAETAVLVGRAHYALEQWEAAFERLTAAIDSGAEGPLPWLFRGRSAMKAGAFEAAFESYEAVQRLAGKGDARMRTEAATNCARLPDRAAREALRLVRAGDLDRAWALAGFGVKHRPGDPLAEKVRAEVVRCLTTKFRSDLRKRPDDAIDTGWLLLERDPENLVALRVLPRLLMRERRFDRAYDLLKRLKRLDPGEPSLELQFARCERWKSALDGQARTTAERLQRAAN